MLEQNRVGFFLGKMGNDFPSQRETLKLQDENHDAMAV